MANQLISMSKVRQILRLHSRGESIMGICRLTGVSRNTLKKYIRDYARLQLNPVELEELSDKDLEELFVQFKPHRTEKTKAAEHLFSLFPEIDKQLKRKGMTQQIQWENYKKENPDGLASTQFGYYYAIWKQQVNPVMHLEHKAGDKILVDYAGEKLHIIDRGTGEIIPVEVFVSVLGSSQLTYVEASLSQKKEDFIASCDRALYYIGGVPNAIVTDNLKAAVTKSSKYEPEINEDFADWASHYSMSVLPTRAYKPRDKAIVEGAVKIIYTRIYSKIGAQEYYSMEELNAAILTALEEHNNMLLQGRDYSRRQQFEEIEKPALQPLPKLRYEFKQQSYATVMKNNYVRLGCDKSYYSVPYQHIGKKVKLLYSNSTVEVFYNYEKIASHERNKAANSYTTEKEHLASTHRYVAEWSPEKFLSWALSIDEVVRQYIFFILNKNQHVEQSYKSCAGILGFAKTHGKDRLINACKRAIQYDMYGYNKIKMILKRGLDKETPDEITTVIPLMPKHDNIRGNSYYQ
jgi:transposase